MAGTKTRILVMIPVAIVALLALAVIWMWFVPPGRYEPPPRELQTGVDSLATDVAGWYRDRDDLVRLVTWSAAGGLSVNRFSEPVQSFITTTENRCRLLAADGERELRRMPGPDGRTRSLWMRAEENWARWLVRSPSVPYDQHEVRYTNGDVELAGVLFTPAAGQPVAGIVFVHGSGISDRDNFWYLFQADYLARRGLAVLLPDKRGCGQSRGHWHTADFGDFARDVTAAVDVLVDRTGLAPERVGLVSFSEGGWITPLAAAELPELGFVVSVSGSATTPRQQLRHALYNEIRAGGAPGFLAAWLEPLFTRRTMAMRATWWQDNGDFDPLPHWRRAACPVLVILGRLDESDNTPVQRSLDLLTEVAAAGADRQWTFQVHDDLGHAMIDDETGWISRSYLDRMAYWIGATVGALDRR